MLRHIFLIVALHTIFGPVELHGQEWSPVHIKVTSHLEHRADKNDGPHYNVQLTSQDNTLISNLALMPIRNSIFSPNFKFQLASTDPVTGKLVLEEVRIPNEQVKDVETGLYVDVEKSAVLKFSKPQLEITGVMQEKAITFENGQHFMTEHRLNDSNLDNDYVQSSMNLPLQMPIMAQTRSTYTVEKKKPATSPPTPPPQYNPELSIIVDASNYNDLHQDPANILNYFAVLMHTVNIRYATIPDFKVNFTIAGITALKSPADQPFINECYERTVGGGCDVTGVLMASFSQWVFNNSAILPKSDMTTLVHNVVPGGNGANGAGWIARACRKNVANVTDQSTSVVADRGGSFAGVHTMTHELAHVLGSPHDGEMVEGQDSRSCPFSDGYIMSYAKYGGPNKFRFSSCSIACMKSYLAANGACLTTTENPDDHPPATTQGGEFVSMNVQCQTQFKYNPNVFACTYGRDYNDQCRKLICVIQALYYPGDQQIVSDGYYPAELSSCGVNGVCQDGNCVNRPSLSAQCKAALKDKQASVDTSLSPDALCQNLGCTTYDSNGVAQSKLVGKPPLEFSSCGVNGRCIDKTCRQPPPAPDMTRQCQILLNNSAAIVKPTDSYGIVTPDTLCSYLTCIIGPTAYQSPLPPMDFTPCGESGNFCFRGTCNTLANHSDLQTRRTTRSSSATRSWMMWFLQFFVSNS